MRGLARQLGTSVPAIESLQYGGKGRADTVERVEAAFLAAVSL